MKNESGRNLPIAIIACLFLSVMIVSEEGFWWGIASFLLLSGSILTVYDLKKGKESSLLIKILKKRLHQDLVISFGITVPMGAGMFWLGYTVTDIAFVGLIFFAILFWIFRKL